MAYTNHQPLSGKAAWPSTSGPASLHLAFGRGKRCRAGANSLEQESGRSEGQRRLIVKPLPPVRQAAAPPRPVAIEHSPSFLLRDCSWQEADEAKPIATRSRDEEPFTGNAMQWAVRRIDAGLDTAETNPPPGAKALINAARGPAGAATVKGVTAAAQLTVKVGTEALKAAAPVGKWIAQQSFKAAFGGFKHDTRRKQHRIERDEEDDI